MVIQEDTKVPNSAIFVIAKEDHTLANMLKAQLLHNPQVRFAGYKVPHPLEPRVELNIQTTDETTPVKALELAIEELQSTANNILTQFKKEVDTHQEAREPYQPM